MRFPNECLADAGLRVLHLDLVGRNDGTRLIRLAQKKSPSGCPEIWQPVTRRFLIEIGDGDDFSRIMVMDWSGGGKGSDELLQTLTFNREDVALAEDTDFSGSFIKTSPMFPGKMLPVLDDIVITAGTRMGHLRDYRISFSLRYPSHFRTRNSISVYLMETRTGVSDRTGQPVVDWLFVLIPGDHQYGEARGPMENIRYTFVLQMLQTYKHRLAVVNPGSVRGAPTERVVRVYDVP